MFRGTIVAECQTSVGLTRGTVCTAVRPNPRPRVSTYCPYSCSPNPRSSVSTCCLCSCSPKSQDQCQHILSVHQFAQIPGPLLARTVCISVRPVTAGALYASLHTLIQLADLSALFHRSHTARTLLWSLQIDHSPSARGCIVEWLEVRTVWS